MVLFNISTEINNKAFKIKNTFYKNELISNSFIISKHTKEHS